MTDFDKKASMKNLSDESADDGHEAEPEIDDQGTDQETAAAILTSLRDDAFDGSDEKLALALGRPAEEVTSSIDGSKTIDGDVLLKARNLAMERGIEIPE
jgi:hypothetical protein